jgi:hypothetical protein
VLKSLGFGEVWPEKTAAPTSAAGRPSPALKEWERTEIRERGSGFRERKDNKNKWKSQKTCIYIPLLFSFSPLCRFSLCMIWVVPLTHVHIRCSLQECEFVNGRARVRSWLVAFPPFFTAFFAYFLPLGL